MADAPAIEKCGGASADEVGAGSCVELRVSLEACAGKPFSEGQSTVVDGVEIRQDGSCGGNRAASKAFAHFEGSFRRYYQVSC